MNLEQTLADLQASQQQLADALLSAADRQDWRPAPDEWSFREVAAHLEASERECVLARVQAIASGSHPAFDSYSNTGRDFGLVDLEASLRGFADARAQVIDLVRGLSVEQLSYTGHHLAFGDITAHDYLQIDLEHDRGHQRDLERSLAAARNGPASTATMLP